MYPSSFVTLHNENQTRWIKESCDINDVTITIFALLEQIGDDSVIVDYVNSNLARQVFGNDGLKELTTKISQGQVDLSNDDTVEKILTQVFMDVNDQCKNLKCDGSVGAAAVMTLFVNDFLYTVDYSNVVVVLGKEIGDPVDLALFPMTESHHGISETLSGYFGKSETSKPKVVGGIQINKSIKFLIFANASLMHLVTSVKHDEETTGTSHLTSMLLDRLRTSSDITSEIEQALTEISEKYKSETDTPNLPYLALAYVDLSNEIQLDSQKVPHVGLIPSYVDWSDFYQNPSKDEVIAKIESLKMFYKSKKNLHSIAED
ncbi:unnamed protein product [Bursaphelenchus okinawaensis]|uniref:Uncharacterized protein n=1 Tax=Bursaphelenchus okinawaensis TaxID=465554 RepID=A0A811K5A6_9BILA|nr:unnamed protein product [Bursaphelenchus okinawaensis]CAG9091652.1 unnamed protein product [Bursaphelenchus okinawaensis]